MVGSMRLVCAVILAAVAISTLIGAATEWQLRQELTAQWAETRAHIGE